jgi:hypothetical protein
LKQLTFFLFFVALQEYISNGGKVISEARLAWTNENGFANEKVPGNSKTIFTVFCVFLNTFKKEKFQNSFFSIFHRLSPCPNFFFFFFTGFLKLKKKKQELVSMNISE